ncbi:MAG TPA: GNAT family N-acetyltransferase [Pseudonocardiaceae bacterium]|jgi:predicted acetyltransferase|nr:GNAT family N-acetyltransferase [Pseudonocardiaceae bacterium]
MDFAVRTITEDEVPSWCGAMNTGFLNPAGDVDAEARRPGLHLDRTWGGFDGGRMVATLRSFPCQMTVPGGGALAASAVTAVTTTSTHRRRGLASRLIAAELAASRERGEPVSILIAAEWRIYGRFGYGPATEHQTWTVDAGAARLRQPPRGSVEYADRDTARALAPEVYQRHRVARPGEISRPGRFWDIDFGILRYPSWPDPRPALSVVARDCAGAAIGVARYAFEEKWAGRQPRGQVSVQLFVTGEAAAEALLWNHLLSLDLVSSVRVEDRPADELLPWLLTDARHAQPSDRSDFLWLRPLDVAGMLAARSYLVPGRVVLDVVDTGGLTGGRFALDAGPDGACCVPTTASADLILDVAALGSIYLGGYRVRTLAAVGLIDEHSPGAVARADAMFRCPVTPWCSTWF